MKTRKQLLTTFSVLLIAALLVACVSPPTAIPVPPTATSIPPTTPEPLTGATAKTSTVAEAQLEPHQPRPDAPPYGVRGSYAVGVRDFVIDSPERKIPVTVWYPAQNPEAAEEAVTYTMDFLADPAAGFPTGGRALRDAAPDPSGGAYPLVLYSHGGWCFPAIAGFFAEHLASHGFVVMAAVHEDNWGTLGESTYKSEISRPQDMVRQLDFAEELTAPKGEMAGLIDMEHVAVTGQSFGGQIALQMGGARLNLAEWQKTFCVEFPEDEDCKAYPAHFKEMAALAGLEAVPEGLWPDWSDPRIDVVVATAPGVSMLGGGGLDEMRRPIMLLNGTNDNWVGAALEYRQAYETLPGPDKTRVLFENADHMIFGNACPAYPGMVEAGFYFVCMDSVWDIDRANDLTNHFATAFLLAELKGDAEAAKALAPENVTFPGIKYETTAYGAAAAKPAPAPEVFVQGAPVRLPVGLAVGPDDNLYVGSQWVRSLPVLNPETGEIIKSLGPEQGVDIPADLAFGPDGSLYASMYPGFEGDSVMRMAPDGTVTSMALPPIIWPVMTTIDGRLFAALLLDSEMIVELDPDFKAPQRQVVSDGNFIHMREGPDGMIYAIRWLDDEIVRFDPDAPDKVETVVTGLTMPFNLAFDSKGQLYVIMGIDDTTDAVARLDLATGKPEILATMHNLLYGLAIDSKDRIFVSSASDGTIFEVLPKGDIRIVSPGGMILPSDVEVIARPDGESLFLADWGAWREYDTATGELRSARHGTWWPGTLTNPDTIAPFGDYLLLASSENKQIQIWDPVQQKEVLLISVPGVDNAIGFDDAIVATSYETKDVVRIDPAKPDQRSVLATGLDYPLGLASGSGNLYVGDFLAGQILQVAANGVKLDPPKLVAKGLQGPEGLALTGDGRLLVVESGADRLSLVDLSSGQITPLATDLGIMRDVPRSRPLHYFFNGVDISPSGMIYVTADDANAIYRIPLPKPTSKLDDASVTKIEALVGKTMQENKVPGYAMCVVKDGSEVYSQGFGVAVLGGDRPVSPQSVFAIRSTTKSFTAVALMQLVEQGKVDLDKPVTDYLPYFNMADPRYKDITVRMLASHMSGLTDEAVTATLPKSEEPTAVDAALEWYVRSLSDDKLTAAPGETWQYAGVNFSILGDLIGKMSDLPYDKYVVQNILEPLKMTHSTFDAAAIPPDALVGEHVTGEGAVVKATPLTDFSGRSMPEGGIYSTCDDMTRWMQAHLNRGELDGVRILKSESYDILWKVEAPTGLDEFFGAWAGQYGLGWGVAEDGGHFLAGHPGGGEGQNINFQLAPDDNLGVVVLANWGTETIAFPAWMAAADVTYALLGIDK